MALWGGLSCYIRTNLLRLIQLVTGLLWLLFAVIRHIFMVISRLVATTTNSKQVPYTIWLPQMSIKGLVTTTKPMMMPHLRYLWRGIPQTTTSARWPSFQATNGSAPIPRYERGVGQ